MDQQRLLPGMLAGVVVGVCAGAVYVAPGALLARQVPDSVRTLSSVAALFFTLFYLWLLFEWLSPDAEFTRDLRSGCPAFVASLTISALVGDIWRRSRTIFFERLTVTRAGPVES